MIYKDKAVEVLGTKQVLGEKIAWVRFLEDNSFKEVAFEDLEEKKTEIGLPYIRFVALAAKIKDEIAKKNLLAPYESSLIPLPHQILVLEKVMQSSQNRFLLADEVGMGKTIETGLLIKELKLRGDINRILVIVPKSSMLQWQSELKEHFNEVFNIYDSEMITSMARTFSNINADQEFNFWEQHNQIIVSTDALKPLVRRHGWSKDRIEEYNRYRLEAVLDANFDMVVIDEAHKMGGANPTVSRYILAQSLCNSVANVLLLTATPHRGKSDHFRRILQLLDPDAFAGEGLPDLEELEPYVIRTEKRLAVDYEGNKLFNVRETHRLNVFLDPSKHQKQINLYNAVTNYVIKGFNTAKRSGNGATGLIMILFQRLVSSSTAAILSAMEGRLERLRNGEDSIDDYDNEVDGFEEFQQENLNAEGVYYTPGESLPEEEEIILADLIEQAKDCLNTELDAKAAAFRKKYKELQIKENNTNLKVIIFTEFRSTQKMLFDFLTQSGYQCSIINGAQDLDQRKTALSNFKTKSQILIATDAAAESLNMQFCHIVFNYDLPWNPMMIEQRIGRVDRIGQKNQVVAYNMLTNNSVDLRVYEVIEEKLNNILQQLGIDKTSDVLDSTLDMENVNDLYLQSLLDPDRFEFAGNKWLNEIKSKLKDYQSTEGILPEVKEDEIEYKKAADVKHSPISKWLENLFQEYVRINRGSLQHSTNGHFKISLGDKIKNISFDSEISLNDPGVEHITLQHDWTRKILSEVGGISQNGQLPVIRSKNGNETAGIWSIWHISAHNAFENKESYQCFFVSDEGKMFAAYANDIWNRLLAPTVEFEFVSETYEDLNSKNVLEPHLITAFQNLKIKVLDEIARKEENKLNSFDFQESRIKKIGIDNIRESKLKRLNTEKEAWNAEFQRNKKVIPGTKKLLSFRLNG
jgi:superfamily II DNA or RNA helicase